jgi:hypothetical protein
MAAMNNGAIARVIKERDVLGTIARLAEAGRQVGVPNHPRASCVPA